MNYNKEIKWRLYTTLGYIILISLTIGASIIVGVIVAPTLFNSELLLLDSSLNNYEEGLLMSAVFQKYNYFLTLFALLLTIFEANEYKQARRDSYAFTAAFLTLSTALLFVGYYTPAILQMQAIGIEATNSEVFEAIHKGSELDFKLMLISMFGLLIRRSYLLLGKKQ